LSSLPIREQPLEPLPVRSGIERTALTPQADVGTSAPELASIAAAVDVRVLVLARDDRRPLTGFDVELAWWSLEGGSPAVRGTTDATGAVQLRLEPGDTPHEPLCTIAVAQGERTRRFGAIPLRDEIVVLMDACTRLHGQLVISGADAGARAWVQANEPRRGTMSCPVMLCLAQATDGRFEPRPVRRAKCPGWT
jgi:hypothetical protein